MFGFLKKKKQQTTLNTGTGSSRKLSLNTTTVPTGLKPEWQDMVNHVYHFPQRLVVDKNEPVKTITGKVVSMTSPPDGDYHIIVDIGMGKTMECEIICAHKTTQPDAIPYCENYVNKVLPIPSIGDKVQVTGLNVVDECHGPHPEIHPVFELKKIL